MSADDRGSGNGRTFDRQALQATLADLVRATDQPEGGAPSADRADVAALTPSHPGDRPLVAAPPSVQAQAPNPSSVPAPDGARPPMSGRPRLPFSPGPSPSPQGQSPLGTVRPGSGGPSAAPSATGFTTGPGSSPAPSGIGGLHGLGGRIGPDSGDLVRLAPSPVEQPTVPLRRRRPTADDRPAAVTPEADSAAAAGPAPASAAQASKEAKTQVVIEAWVPGNDDILPQRPARAGRSSRRRR